MVCVLGPDPLLYPFRPVHLESVSPREPLHEDLGIPRVGLNLSISEFSPYMSGHHTCVPQTWGPLGRHKE